MAPLTGSAPRVGSVFAWKAIGGIALAFSLDPAELLAQGAAAARLPGSPNNTHKLEAWVRITGIPQNG